MRTITRVIGKTRLNRKPDGKQPTIRRVLICRPNHRLGNLLLITPLLRELSNTWPHAKLDLFVKGPIASVIFKNHPNIDRIIQLPKEPLKEWFKYCGAWIAVRKNHYDIVINVVFNSSSGRICAQTARATYRFLGDIDPGIPLQFSDYLHMAKFPVYTFRYFIGRMGYRVSNQPVPAMDLNLQRNEIAEGRNILDGLVNNEQRTIAIYTYATGHKRYDREWWLDFYDRLKEAFPSYNIVEVLPIENVSQIGFLTSSYYSRELRKIGAFIANADIFIGADSGMMHLASASLTPVVGLFKSENMDVYAPYNEGSVGVNTNETTSDGCVRIIAEILGRRAREGHFRPSTGSGPGTKEL